MRRIDHRILKIRRHFSGITDSYNIMKALLKKFYDSVLKGHDNKRDKP